jgi:ferritin-like metal-binding protein YciE
MTAGRRTILRGTARANTPDGGLRTLTFRRPTMSVETLEDLFTHELKDLYSAETQILKALPKMAKAATNPELKRAFEKHLKQTEEQVQRIETIFDSLEGKPRGKKCVGMEGLLEEGTDLMQEDMPKPLLDTALIGAAQKVEHYEIAGYGTARALVERLGMKDAVRLLQTTLDEEGETDKTLTSIAQRVNSKAEAAD